nr:hypothetical protein BDOA9_0164230 [Bradyrhizobium sp. DOA9]
MAAAVQRLKRFENIRARLELVVPGLAAEGRTQANAAGDIRTRNRRADNAAFGASPQGFGPAAPLRTPPNRPSSIRSSPKTPPLWPYRGRGGSPQPRPHGNVRQVTRARRLHIAS